MNEISYWQTVVASFAQKHAEQHGIRLKTIWKVNLAQKLSECVISFHCISLYKNKVAHVSDKNKENNKIHKIRLNSPKNSVNKKSLIKEIAFVYRCK